jgi:hypothetical protein
MLSNARAPHLAGAALLAVVAAILLSLGGLALWADSRKDADGYLSTDAHRFAAGSRALTTGDLDLDGLGTLVDSGAGGDNVRFQVTSGHHKPVFVGVARTRDASAYLRRVAHTTVTDVSTSPFRAQYEAHRGTARPGAPARQRFWAASAQGTGRQTVAWDAADGSWSVVVMNADGSRGVAVDVSAGAKAPFLDEIGWGALGAGLLVLGASAALVARGVRRSRPRVGAPLASPAG